MPTFKPGTSATTMLLLHGTGGSERDLMPIAKRLAPQAALLSVGGRVSENGQARYFRHLPEGGFDFADLANQTDWLLTTVAELLAKSHRRPDKTIVVGYSNGANIAARAMLHQSVPWQDAIFFHPMRLGQEAPSQELTGRHVWLSHGAGDSYASADNFTALTTLFSGLGADVTTYHHDRGHQLTQAELTAVQSWLNRLKEG